MAQLIVLSMKTHRVVGRFTDEDAAEACHAANTPAHTIRDGDLTALSTRDLAAVYNACAVGVAPVKKFQDRATAERRVLEVLNGTMPAEEVPVPPPPLELTPTDAVAHYVVTQTGAKEGLRFQKTSNRYTVFNAIKAAGKDGITLPALITQLAPVTRGQIRGCLDKLRAMNYIKIA